MTTAVMVIGTACESEETRAAGSAPSSTSTAPTTLPPPVAQSMPAVEEADVSLIPLPNNLELGQGAFVIDADTTIAVSDPANEELRSIATLLSGWIHAAGGVSPTLSEDPSLPAGGKDNTIVLHLTEAAGGGHPEGYDLEVRNGLVTVTAVAPAGLFYGVQTLRQLLSDEATDGSAWIPAVTISDAPRFAYRGMHLDVTSHLYPVSFIEKYIDLLALYKLNTFHWHLTDDQGWRIEIAGYPRLTEIGAYRAETMLEKNLDPYIGDGEPYGGFYTQDEILRIVEFAADRYVTVIPEIEMPGHSMAALASYPELACTAGPWAVETRWGVFDSLYCPTEETFGFLEDVLIEVMDLFPSQYVHLGGDEVPKHTWKVSPIAQEVIAGEGLEDEEALQSYFMGRMADFLSEHGRRAIGWDEILEGGLIPDATVMSWRGVEGGIEAARQGHDAIMSPVTYAYFDYYQGDPATEPLAIGGFTPLEAVYDFEPVPTELTATEANHILGAQGNVWTEYMPTSDHVEYMAFPRLLALAEVVWSPQDARDWDDFSRRLAPNLELLDDLDVNYRPLDP